MRTICALALIAFSDIYPAFASCVYNTQLHLRSSGGDGKKLPSFSYEGISGPTNWHALEAGNTQCACGQNQSPINIEIDEVATTSPGDVRMEIPAGQTITFENLGTTVEVVVKGKTVFGGRKFNLKQFHYHTPSEHRIESEYYPVEVHMVHEADDSQKDIVVIGMLFQLSACSSSSTTDSSSAIFSNVLSNISSIAQPGASIELGPSEGLDFGPFTAALPSMSFFAYSGSLTTPPCTEGVTFLVATKPMSMSVETYNELKKVVKFNSRFLQNELGEQNLLMVAKTGLENLKCKRVHSLRRE